jgi:hypothetical protein
MYSKNVCAFGKYSRIKKYIFFLIKIFSPAQKISVHMVKKIYPWVQKKIHGFEKNEKLNNYTLVIRGEEK